MITDFKPVTLALESFEGPLARRNDRVRELCGGILDLASANSVETQIYSRADIKAQFEEIGASTRYEIASAIASRIDAFAHELPPKRKIWLPESSRMGLFNAAAVALTHYALRSPS